jgi:gluconate kinase
MNLEKTIQMKCNFLEQNRQTHFAARNMVATQHQIFEKMTISSYEKLNFSTQKACEIFSTAVLKQA